MELNSVDSAKKLVDEKYREYEAAKNEYEQAVRDHLLDKLEVGKYYAITKDEPHCTFISYYICKYDGSNIYIHNDFGTYVIFDGKTIIKEVEKDIKMPNGTLRSIINYSTCEFARLSLYRDELYIEEIDPKDIKKIIRSFINKF